MVMVKKKISGQWASLPQSLAPEASALLNYAMPSYKFRVARLELAATTPQTWQSTN